MVLDVGDLLGLAETAITHISGTRRRRVQQVIDQIVADYDSSTRRSARTSPSKRRTFETQGLAALQHAARQIRARYAGVPVGYSESIFQPLGEALGLKLLTPYSFAKAIAEGTDVSAPTSRRSTRRPNATRSRCGSINSQNVTPDVQRVNELARAAHIPIATITETLSPASDSFEQWQVAELQNLQQALHQATGKLSTAATVDAVPDPGCRPGPASLRHRS